MQRYTLRYFKVNLFLASVFIGHTFSTEMSSCKDSKGMFPNMTYSINSYICESSPCDFIYSCKATLSIDFIVPRYLENMKSKALATAMGFNIDYDLEQDDACDGFTNTQCPVVKNEKVNYKYQLSLPPIFPEMTITLRWSMEDEDTNEDIFCFVFDLTLKKTVCPP